MKFLERRKMFGCNWKDEVLDWKTARWCASYSGLESFV